MSASKEARRMPYDMFGVECDKGWEKLYKGLIDLCALYDVPVLQVKEKFGGLRFYHGGSRDASVNATLEALVRAAEDASYHTCETCGEDGVEGHDKETRQAIYKANPGGKGWVKTLCEPCRATRK